MRKFDKIAIVTLHGKDTPHFVGLTDLGDRWDLRWGAGGSGYSLDKNELVIVKEYPFDPSGDEYDQIEAFENEWLTEKAVPQEPCARLGYIAPNGDFYPCGYVCHNGAAEALGRKFYPNEYIRDDYGLQKKGWIAIKGGALIIWRDESGSAFQPKGTVTEAQQNTLLKIIEAFEDAEALDPNINWDAILTSNPEGYSAQTWLTRPTEDLFRGETFAKALRAQYEGDFNRGENRTEAPKLLKRPGDHPGD